MIPRVSGDVRGIPICIGKDRVTNASYGISDTDIANSFPAAKNRITNNIFSVKGEGPVRN